MSGKHAGSATCRNNSVPATAFRASTKPSRRCEETVPGGAAHLSCEFAYGYGTAGPHRHRGGDLESCSFRWELRSGDPLGDRFGRGADEDSIDAQHKSSTKVETVALLRGERCVCAASMTRFATVSSGKVRAAEPSSTLALPEVEWINQPEEAKEQDNFGGDQAAAKLPLDPNTARRNPRWDRALRQVPFRATMQES